MIWDVVRRRGIDGIGLGRRVNSNGLGGGSKEIEIERWKWREGVRMLRCGVRTGLGLIDEE